MKYKYGEVSTKRLHEATQDLKTVFVFALNLGLIDITILEAHRSESKQNRLRALGRSRLRYPKSKHNSYPSRAIDAAPYINGKVSFDHKHCIYLAGIITSVAKIYDVKIRWGGNWDMNGEPITDQHFQDLVHYEVI